jgi:RNA polymerase sigma-70 factor (ECF subfamily)
MDLGPEPNIEVESLAAGDPAAYAALYARLARPLLRVAAAMLADAGEAEDAVHDVFVALARGRERLRYVEDLDAYAFASLRHAIAARIDRRRIERRHWERLASIPVPARASPESADEGELSAALAALPPEQREIVAMKIDSGLTFAQIAQVLGISPNTAASRYRYALEKLRKFLEDRT